MSTPTPGGAPGATPGAATDEHGRIAVDLACLKCGYNLRTCRRKLHENL